ncbi:MAG: hypothetical protein ACYTGB_13995, partial [Planctomycetota bacterium]
MNKDQVFWVVWGVVIAAAGGFYVFKVRDMQATNEKLLKEKRYLAARFMDGLPETKWIQHETEPNRRLKTQNYGKRNPEAAEFTRDYDKRLYRLYPLANTKKIRLVPNPAIKKDIEALDKALKDSAASLSKDLLAKYNFKVNPKTDFDVNDQPPGDARRFREWVGRQNEKIDAIMDEMGKGISFDLKTGERELTENARRLNWLPDGSVTGWVPAEGDVVRPAEGEKVLRRLVL